MKLSAAKILRIVLLLRIVNIWVSYGTENDSAAVNQDITSFSDTNNLAHQMAGHKMARTYLAEFRLGIGTKIFGDWATCAEATA
jgi:hypothetical protein